MARVVIQNLDKDFLGPKKEPIHALRDVSLVVEDKELVVLVGPSGCGKTTLLRIIAGLEESSRGGVSIDGKAMSRVPAKDRDVAMVFQNYALYPHMTIYDNIAFGLMLRKYTKSETERRVLEAAEILGLKSCLTRMPNQLSGGERQRVALGRTIVRKPKVFLLDEPLSNLDAVMRSQMRVELAKLHARLEATMLYVTHDQVEAMTLGHRIAVMNEGALQQVAEPMALYRSPANAFVAGFVGSPPMNFIRGNLRTTRDCLWFDENTNGNGPGQEWPVFCLRSRVRSRLESFVDRDVLLGIRPEDIAVELAAGDAKTEAQDAAPLAKAAIEVVEPRGAESFLHLAIGQHALVARVHPDFSARVGDTVSVVFNLEGAHFFDPATGLSIVAPGGTVGV